MSSALPKILLALFAVMLIAHKSDGQAMSMWCVADPKCSLDALQQGLDWACGAGGADCSMIQPNQPCYLPNTIKDHASFAFNNYFQKFKAQGIQCDFTGCATIINVNPSHDACIFQ